MYLNPEQVKGRIRNISKDSNADARTLIRVFMMERFLERLATSSYKNFFVLKGGILVTSMVGVALRSTMDIDTSLINQNLSEEDVVRIVREIIDIDVGDGVTFVLKRVSMIMDEMEYPGVRCSLGAVFDNLITPMKIDISTGDVITPGAVEYPYKLMLENRSIRLWAYNIETVLAEKLQTILARGILNTRMRDFYDIKILLDCCGGSIDDGIFNRAYTATCKKRNTENIKANSVMILSLIEKDDGIHELWNAYQKKYVYASGITFETIIRSVRSLMDRIR